MTSKKILQNNQQQKSDKSQESGILQRAAVRSNSEAGVQFEEQEALALTNSGFSKDFSQVFITTTKPQPIMAKLMIGAVGDKYEQEADRVAAQVVQQINAPASVQSGEDETVQRETMETKDNKPRLMMSPILQRMSNSGVTATPNLEASINQARGGGQPLADIIRLQMEQSFGADFSGVRVHTDAQADQLNQAIQAKAFTTGQDVFFRQGEYQPMSRGGQELIAHELTHVVQQNGGAVQKSPQPHDAIEKTQGKYLAAENQVPGRVSSKVIQRQVVINMNQPLPGGQAQIANVVVNRDNMRSLFQNAQGDHTTAFGVFRAMFQNRLQNQTLNQARVVLDNIFLEITLLPGAQNLGDAPQWAQNEYNDQLQIAQQAQQQAQNAGGGGVTGQQINQYASELLSLRNVVPLSAGEFGGTGHGEGTALNTMNQLEQQLANGNPLNLNNLTQPVVVLLDTNRFESANQHPLNDQDQEILPGLVINGQNPIVINRQRMAEQHVQSIESAYPHIQQALAANGGIARQNLINNIVIALQNAG